MKYVYHYCANQHHPDKIANVHGTIVTTDPVVSQERYRELVELLAKDAGMEPDNVTVTSFSLIHKEPNP